VFGFADPIREVYLACRSPVRPAVLADAREIAAQGGRVVAVSNGIRRRIGIEWYRSQHALRDMELIDADSVGVRKPSAAFFAACGKRHGVPLSRLALVDDNAQYARCAADLGITSYHFLIGPTCSIVPSSADGGRGARLRKVEARFCELPSSPAGRSGSGSPKVSSPRPPGSPETYA
jgi:FMN phosphatase YigB (HAD superfamily)